MIDDHINIRVGAMPPRFASLDESIRNNVNEMRKIRGSYENFCQEIQFKSTRIDTVTNMLKYLNSVASASQIPSSINLDIEDPVFQQIAVGDLVSTIKLTNKLNALRFGEQHDTIITVRAGEPISYATVDRLLSAGVDVIVPKLTVHGADAAVDFHFKKIKGDQYPSYLIDKNKTDFVLASVGQLHIPLTPQQHKIAHCVAKRGLSNKQIAKQFDIGESTVKLHIGLILKKYGIQNRTQLALAMTTGLQA